MTNHPGKWIMILSFVLSSACSGSPGRPAQTPAPSDLVSSSSPSPAPSSTPTSRPLPAPTRQPPPTTAAPAARVCSPLQGLALIDLPETVVNPFSPPPPGSDDPHQGVDFGDLRAGDRIALAGRQVLAVLPARVAAVMADRFPYGNALLLETPLDELPENWLEEAELPTPGPDWTPNPALTCPEGFSISGSSRRSLYLLYAHMLEPPELEVGEAVSCGQEIGAIGSSGNALNPHLHLEARLGPASVQFGSLAHYDPSATQEEMSNYCAWRVSGSFQAFDPLRLLRTGP